MKNLKFKKTISSLVIIFLMLTLCAQAQTEKKITFGIKSGVSYSTIGKGFKALSNKSGDVGYNFGVFARTTDRLYFQSELNFAAFTNEYDTNTKNYKEKSQQINIPLMVGYTVWNKGNFGIRVAGGPDLNYNLKDTVKDGLADTRLSAGGLISLEVDYGKFALESKYSMGFTDINKKLNQSLNIQSISIAYRIF